MSVRFGDVALVGQAVSSMERQSHVEPKIESDILDIPHIVGRR